MSIFLLKNVKIIAINNYIFKFNLFANSLKLLSENYEYFIGIVLPVGFANQVFFIRRLHRTDIWTGPFEIRK